MGRGMLTEEEVRVLYESPHVSAIRDNRIVFTEEFKKHFMEEYNSGKKGPTQIFREAGFDTRMLGSKRIERAAARWKESYDAGTLGTYSYGTNKEDKQTKQIKALKEENELLKKQLKLLQELYDLREKAN